ncbi:bifunctional 2-C-methyl-D-erythritol 4-phosphate cytidylyltransferase/2-C-methyl-D-erythritol 2,4-cyclodiphosphate synthase [Pseudaestuariivita sp.]|uniref:bifunctional 2-C-methyl-D-erythritol 4-phosphate cytidylyltransferase/2-C-methyl-D-erythritol 2,4-cyclodiphosphate synthase n=1 Tax=Pseudaestuariivita sp. TaxID=2211669 RepID=UPI004059D7E0
MSTTPSFAALIVAAGRGRRAGGDIPKQWQTLAGQPVAAWTVARFRAMPQISRILLVVHPDDAAYAEEITGVTCVPGGATRAASVRAGLAALAEDPPSHVLIHDVARCTVPAEVIAAVCHALETHDGAAPGLEVSDALWRVDAGAISGTQDRGGLFRAQTPQGFDYAAITAAHDAFPGEAADDVEVARAAGLDVACVPGDEANLKITTPGDFARAEALLRTTMDIRLGNGFDVHRFGPGDHVTLCGLDIPHPRGLQGHSDADVGLHTITDALYGALAEGDIGQHFPPSDPQWKGAASDIFLKHAVALVAERGYRIANVDLTLICEAPKIGPHAPAMRAHVAGLMGLDVAQVSIKATTSERLGFTGREEGIAALATAALVRA